MASGALLVLVLAATPASQSGETAARIESLPAVEAYAWLNALNKREELITASFMMPLRGYKSLKAASCFGVRVGDKRMAGESSGKDYGIRGYTMTKDGQEAAKVFIGVLHSEFAFALAGNSLPAGAYALMAQSGILEIHGGDPAATHYDANRRRQVPNSKVDEIALRVSLPPEQLAEKAPTVPAFAIRVADGQLVLTIGDNTLPLTPK